MIRTAFRVLVLFAALSVAPPVVAQEDDRAPKPAEPDFTLVNLPTSLRLPQWGANIRITHRFTRPLKCDECPNSLLGDALGLDGGAVIGLEARLGLIPNGQIVFHRSRLDKAIQFLGEYSFTRQNETMPVEMAAIVSVEGTRNFQGERSPALGLAITRMFGEAAAVHFDPLWVNNTNLLSDDGDDSTFVAGIGGRLRIIPSLYLVAEVAPRVGGYKPGTTLGSVAIEKRIGGHIFQLTFTNYFSTTLRQIAQGAQNGDDWYLGFNLSRKLY